MPRVPALLARVLEARGVPCQVERIEDLSPRFRRVHLVGEGLRGHEWAPCQVTSFRVTPTQFRHYTPDGFDAAAGRMSVLFYRHGAAGSRTAGTGDVGDWAGCASAPAAPGDLWLTRLQVGDTVVGLVPATSRGFRAPTGAGTYLLCGDATTVGLWHALIGSLDADARVLGVVEVPADDVELARALMPGLDVVAQTSLPGAAMLSWFDNRDHGPTGVGAPTHAYVAGHRQTLRRVRDLLGYRHGLRDAVIFTDPYWATGRSGL